MTNNNQRCKYVRKYTYKLDIIFLLIRSRRHFFQLWASTDSATKAGLFRSYFNHCQNKQCLLHTIVSRVRNTADESLHHVTTVLNLTTNIWASVWTRNLHLHFIAILLQVSSNKKKMDKISRFLPPLPLRRTHSALRVSTGARFLGRTSYQTYLFKATILRHDIRPVTQ